jgi:hypothetical protein
MALTEGEWCKLRGIEQQLKFDDPQLSAQLAKPLDPHLRLLRPVVEAFLAMSAVLLVLGVLVACDGLVIGGIIVLLMMPVAVMIMIVTAPSQLARPVPTPFRRAPRA